MTHSGSFRQAPGRVLLGIIAVFVASLWLNFDGVFDEQRFGRAV
jgi:hypothetical protein